MGSLPVCAARMKKTISFTAVHFLVAFTVGSLVTGSLVAGGVLALVEPACNAVAFHLHEMAWKRSESRRARAGAMLAA